MTDPDDAGAASDYLTFHVGDQQFGLPVLHIREIRAWSRPTPLPHAPAHLRGVINLRGSVLPVIDLALRMGLAPVAEHLRTVIVVVECGHRTAGLMVDGVSGIMPLPDTALQPVPMPPGAMPDGCVTDLVIDGGRMIRILDLQAVLAQPGQAAA